VCVTRRGGQMEKTKERPREKQHRLGKKKKGDNPRADNGPPVGGMDLDYTSGEFPRTVEKKP